MSHEMENTKQEQHSYFLYDIDERSQQITLQKNYIGLLVNNQSSSVQQLQIRKKYTFRTSNLFPIYLQHHIQTETFHWGSIYPTMKIIN